MIGDEKLGQRGVKVRCKKCSYVIILRPPGYQPPTKKSGAVPAGGRAAAAPADGPPAERPSDRVVLSEAAMAPTKPEPVSGGDEPETGHVPVGDLAVSRVSPLPGGLHAMRGAVGRDLAPEPRAGALAELPDFGGPDEDETHATDDPRLKPRNRNGAELGASLPNLHGDPDHEDNTVLGRTNHDRNPAGLDGDVPRAFELQGFGDDGGDATLTGAPSLGSAEMMLHAGGPEDRRDDPHTELTDTSAGDGSESVAPISALARIAGDEMPSIDDEGDLEANGLSGESRSPASSGGSRRKAAKGVTAREAPEQGRDDPRAGEFGGIAEGPAAASFGAGAASLASLAALAASVDQEATGASANGHAAAANGEGLLDHQLQNELDNDKEIDSAFEQMFGGGGFMDGALAAGLAGDPAAPSGFGMNFTDPSQERRPTRIFDVGAMQQAQAGQDKGANGHVPATPSGPVDKAEWYVAINDEQVGPMSFDDLKARWDGTEVGPNSLCWAAGMGAWTPIRLTRGLEVLGEMDDDRARTVVAAIETGEHADGDTADDSLRAAAIAPMIAMPEETTGESAAQPPEPEPSGTEEPSWRPSAASALASLAAEELGSPAADKKDVAVGRALPATTDALEKLLSGDPKSSASSPFGAAEASASMVRPLPKRTDLAGSVSLRDPVVARGRQRPNMLLIGAIIGGVLFLLGAIAVAVVMSLRPANRDEAPRPVSPAPQPTTEVAPPPPAQAQPPPQPAAVRRNLADEVPPAGQGAAPATGAGTAPLAPAGSAPAGSAPTGTAVAGGPANTAGSPAPAPGGSAAAAPSAAAGGTAAQPGAAGGAPEPAAAAGGSAPGGNEGATARGDGSEDERHGRRRSRGERGGGAREGSGSRGTTHRGASRGEAPAETPPPDEAPSTDDDLLGVARKKHLPKQEESTGLPAQLDDSDILGGIRRHADAIKTCHSKQASADPAADGMMTVNFVIERSGRTTHWSVSPEKWRSSVIGKCVLEAVKGWTFPRFTGPPIPVDFPVKITGR